LEWGVVKALNAAGADYAYEGHKFPYTIPEQHRTYLLDLALPNGIAIEVKGYLLRADRMKLLRVREGHPQLDLRLVVGRASARCEGLKISIGEWCDKFGFMWAVKTIPEAWLRERPKRVRVETLKRFRREKHGT
jgi:Autographiviridae endonuclease I